MRFTVWCAVLVILAAPLFSLDIQLNGLPHSTWESSQLREHSYPLSLSGERGLSLGEILPLMVSSYRLEIVHSRGQETVSLKSGADDFFHIYLKDTSEGWTLISGSPSLILTKDLRGITSLSVYGEPLDEKDLTCWISWEGTRELKEEIQRFSSLHRLNLNVQEVPKTGSKLISILRAGGTIPDVVMLAGSDLPSLIAAGGLQNLDYMIPPNTMTKGIDSFTLQEKTWAIPFYFDSQLIFYRGDLIAKTELPGDFTPSGWNLEKFEALLESLKRRAIEPISWNVYSAYWLIPFQLGFGKTSLIEDDGGIIINDGPTKHALEYILDLQDRKLLSEKERDGMVSSFISGDVGMILSGSYSIPEFETIKLPFGVLPYPYNEGTGKYISPVLDFKGFAITKRTKRPILARRLIQYLTGLGVQQRFPPAMAKLPVHTGAWEISENANPYYSVLARSMEIGTPLPPEKAYNIYKNTMWKLLRFVLTRQMGIEEVLEEGQSIMDAKQ